MPTSPHFKSARFRTGVQDELAGVKGARVRSPPDFRGAGRAGSSSGRGDRRARRGGGAANVSPRPDGPDLDGAVPAERELLGPLDGLVPRVAFDHVEAAEDLLRLRE